MNMFNEGPGATGDQPHDETVDSFYEQAGRVAELWANRLPEFRDQKDPLEFARESGFEIPPERNKDLLNILEGAHLFDLENNPANKKLLDDEPDDPEYDVGEA